MVAPSEPFSLVELDDGAYRREERARGGGSEVVLGLGEEEEVEQEEEKSASTAPLQPNTPDTLLASSEVSSPLLVAESSAGEIDSAVINVLHSKIGDRRENIQEVEEQSEKNTRGELDLDPETKESEGCMLIKTGR